MNNNRKDPMKTKIIIFNNDGPVLAMGGTLFSAVRDYNRNWVPRIRMSDVDPYQLVYGQVCKKLVWAQASPELTEVIEQGYPDVGRRYNPDTRIMELEEY